MARYFIDVECGDRTVDDEGVIIDSQDAIPAIALRTLFDVLRLSNIVETETNPSVIVRDEAGLEVYRADLAISAGWSSPTEQIEKQETGAMQS